MKDETITRTSKEYFFPEQNMAIAEFMVHNFDEPVLSFLREENGIRKGEHIIVQEKTQTLHKRTSRFAMLQPDGTTSFFGWYPMDNDPATYTVIETWKWTGKQFIPG